MSVPLQLLHGLVLVAALAWCREAARASVGLFDRLVPPPARRPVIMFPKRSRNAQ